MKAQLAAIKRNPRQFAESSTLSTIRELLRALDYAYHDQDKPLVSDEHYDLLRQVHDERAKKPYAKVGFVSSHAARRVKLPVIMGSLNNHKPGSAAFERITQNGPFVVSDKEDGISLALIYEGGKLVKAYQRGDGTTGTDSSGVIPALPVPQKIPTRSLIVRVEFTMNKSTFNRMFSSASGGKYDNPRNGSGGILRRNAPDPTIKKMKCVAHEIMSGTNAGAPLSKQFAYLKTLGFHVVPHKKYAELDSDKLSKILKQRKSKALRMIDGIVVAQDKRYTISGKYPAHAFAYKENSLDSSVVVEVIDIEWNASRYKKLSPRIVIAPTKIGGVTVRYLTGHNAYFIANGYTYQKRNKPPYAPRPINVGAKVRVVRSGDVIPDIIEVVKAARKPSVPKGKVDLVGVDYIMREVSDTSEYKQIVHFFSTLGVDGLKTRTVEKIVDAGFGTVQEIILLEAPDIADAIGHSNSVSLERNIKAALKKNATLLNLAVASSLFGRAFGERRLTPVFTAFPDIHKVKYTKTEIINGMSGVPGYSADSLNHIATTMPIFLKYLKTLRVKVVAPKKIKVESTLLAGKSVLFTSVRDKPLSEWIVKQGGKMASGVKSASMLVIKEGASNNKTNEAERLGIPVFTIDEFKKKYKVRL